MNTPTRKPYPSDLTDAQWQLIESLMPSPHPMGMKGRPNDYSFRENVNRLKKIYSDGRYGGTLPNLVLQLCGWELEVVKKADDQKGFVLLPRRWVVERSFA